MISIRVNFRSKSPSQVEIGGESAFSNISRINVFEIKSKQRIAKESRSSPFFRVNFPNTDKGFSKFDNFKNSSKAYHM